MKKALIIMAAATLFLVGKANAQVDVNIGFATQTVTTTSGNWHDTVGTNGLFIGVSRNFPIASGLNVSLGIQGRYNFKSEEKTINAGILGSAKATAQYSQMLVDIPVLLNYGFELGSGIKLYLMAGPTISYALFGKTKWDANANVLGALNLGSDGEDDWYEEDDKYNKFDIAATFGACLDFNNIKVYGGYNLGLLNLSSADNTTRKSSNLFIGLGYSL